MLRIIPSVHVSIMDRRDVGHARGSEPVTRIRSVFHALKRLYEVAIYQSGLVIVLRADGPLHTFAAEG